MWRQYKITTSADKDFYSEKYYDNDNVEADDIKEVNYKELKITKLE